MRRKIRIKLFCLTTVCVIILSFSIWQLFEYVKLKKNIYAVEMPYSIADSLPLSYQQLVRESRNRFFHQPSQTMIYDLMQRMKIANLDSNEDWEIANLIKNNGSIETPHTITKSDAYDELDFLAKYLKYAYVGYGYVGGEKFFSEIFNSILIEIDNWDEKEIAIEEYTQILQSYLLPNIIDAHCYIGGKSYPQQFPEETYHSFFSMEYIFELQDENYYTHINGQRYKLHSIGTQPYIKSVNPTIVQNGKIAYIPWIRIKSRNDTLSKIMILEDDKGTTIELIVNLNKVYANNGYGSPIYKESYINESYGIIENDKYTYLRNSKLINPEEIKSMINDAAKIDKSKPLIIDVRGNSGGNSMFIVKWLLSYFNISQFQIINVPAPLYYFELETRTLNAAHKSYSIWNSEPELKMMSNGGIPFHMKNDTPIFLLIDGQTASSGEWWVSYIRRLDNVVVIGDNTLGMQIGGNTYSTHLPISNIAIGMSTVMSFDTDLANTEIIGQSPDLFVSPETAIERCIEMIQYYSII